MIKLRMDNEVEISKKELELLISIHGNENFDLDDIDEGLVYFNETSIGDLEYKLNELPFVIFEKITSNDYENERDYTHVTNLNDGESIDYLGGEYEDKKVIDSNELSDELEYDVKYQEFYIFRKGDEPSIEEIIPMFGYHENK